MNKTKFGCLIALIFISLLFLKIDSAYAAGSLTLTIEGADGGYTSPGIGVYYYPQIVDNLEVYAYAYDGYYLVGWLLDGEFWETSYNPIEISLNNPTNATLTLSPSFSTTPHYTLNLSSADSIYIYVNNELTLAQDTGTLKIIIGGTYVTLSFPSSDYYLFNSYLINGTETITNSTYTFYMNGDTSVSIDETYNPPTGALPTIFLAVPPAIIIGALGISFSTIGKQLGDHDYAGFIIGGSMGLIICANSGLLPMWFAISVFLCGFIGVYFWFRSG